MKLAWGLILISLLAPPAFCYEIKGVVRVAEPFPEPKMVEVKKKPHDHFPDFVESSKLLISPEGFLKNAVVSVQGEMKSAATENAAKKKYVLDQREYRFEPHVLVIPIGAALKILNSDPMAHDVRAFDESAKMIFRYDMEPSGDEIEVRFPSAGIYVIRCGLHPWMHAFVFSVAEDTLYAVSDDQGRFELVNLPQDRYEIKIWHETLGTAIQKLELVDSLPDFSYTFQPGTQTKEK